MQKGVKPSKSFVAFFTSALLIATLAATCAWGFPRFGPDNVHNFVGDGFTGSGSCDECHAGGGGASSDVAVGDRLLRWGNPGVDSDGENCTANCHDETLNALPGGDEWTGVNTSRTNPPPLDPHPVIPVDCDNCHNNEFATDTTRNATLDSTSYCNCLSCHTDGISDTLMGVTPAGSDFGVDTEVDKFFATIGNGAVTIPGHMSEHTIIYNTAAVGPAALCSNVNNECLKCHAGAEPAPTNTGHPGVNIASPALLFYPDDELADGITAGTAIIAPDLNIAFGNPPAPTGADWDTYLQESRQLFCLTCHDGQDDGGVGAARLQLGPAASAVPTVPQTVFNMPAQTTTANTAPYFNFYEGNGHGRAGGIEDDPVGTFPMNLTCLAGPDPGADNPALGCHSVHGTQNLSNLDDTNFAAGVNTLREMSVDVCMSANCHSPARVATYPFNLFHANWRPGGGFLHGDQNGVQGLAAWDDTASDGNMNLNPAIVHDGNANLWFFNDPDAPLPPISARLVDGTYNGTPRHIGCITCHDPHGTDTTWDTIAAFGGTAAWSTMGMIKRFYTDLNPGTDPLCGQCH